MSDKWLSLDTSLKDEQIIIVQMNFINLGQVHIWFRTSAGAMLLVRRTSASQISWQPLNMILDCTQYSSVQSSTYPTAQWPGQMDLDMIFFLIIYIDG